MHVVYSLHESVRAPFVVASEAINHRVVLRRRLASAFGLRVVDDHVLSQRWHVNAVRDGISLSHVRPATP